MESTNPCCLEDVLDDLHEEGSACPLPCFPCPWRRRRRGLQHRPLLRRERHHGETWWEERARRAKELLGSRPDGAKSGSLLHRVGGVDRWGGGGGKRRRGPQFQYDPAGYALNFDDGAGREEAECTFLAFAARPPPITQEESYI